VERSCQVGGEVISYDVDLAESPTAVVALHGSGNTNKETTKYLATTVSGAGHHLIRLDFSGQGRSSGQMTDSSLAKRVNEAIGVIEDTGLKLVSIVGTSMGGYVATRLLDRFEIETLILFCPAAYSRAAWNLKFGDGFTEEIRRPDSFLETDVRDSCQDFCGRVLFFIGNADTIIPPQVTNIYETAFPRAKSFERVVLEDCPHPIHGWVAGRPRWQELVKSKVGEVL